MRSYRVAAVFVMIVLGAAPALGDIEFDFDTNDGGFTSTLNTAAFDGPWIYGATAGEGGSGGWSTEGQNSEIGHACTTDLNSPPLKVTSSADVVLTFDHRFSFEFDGTRWDGGAVFVSLNGGAFTQVPGANFTAEAYNGTVAANSVSQLANQSAFTAASAGYGSGTFITSIANLGSFAIDDTIQVRLRAAYDTNTSGGSPDWAVDNIALSNTLLADGEACISGSQCASGFCSGGLCTRTPAGVPAMSYANSITVAVGLLLAGLWSVARMARRRSTVP